MVSSRKWEDQSRTKGGKIKMIHLFLSQSGFVRTKYTPPASKLCVIEPTAIKRRGYRKAERQPIRVASEGWNYPNIIAAELLAVIDFCPVGGEAVHNFIATVAGELERLAAGNEHDKYLCHSPNRR